MATTEPKTHDLKCWPEYFEAVADGRKPFEIREDDRGYMEGDTLLLREYDPNTDTYTGRTYQRQVTYILRSSHQSAVEAAVRRHFVVMGLGTPVILPAQDAVPRWVPVTEALPRWDDSNVGFTASIEVTMLYVYFTGERMEFPKAYHTDGTWYDEYGILVDLEFGAPAFWLHNPIPAAPTIMPAAA